MPVVTPLGVRASMRGTEPYRAIVLSSYQRSKTRDKPIVSKRSALGTSLEVE
jgi:hypothetical protein